MFAALLRLFWLVGPAFAFLLIVWVRQWRPDRSVRSDFVANLVGCGLAGAGLLWFLRLGKIAWTEEDWRFFYWCYRSVQEPRQHGHVPYYLIEDFRYVSRYWADLQAPLGPDVLLLGLVSVSQFYVAHALLVFSIGCLGLLALRRELDLTPFTFALLVALFVFNGYMTAHLRAGHAVWIDVPLVPWVFVALIREERQPALWRNGVTLAVTLAALVAAGAWHVFIAAGLFVAFFCVQSRPRLWFGLRVFALLVPVIAYRLVPGLFTFGVGENTFRSGFPSLRVMIEALAVGHTGTALENQPLDWWEFDVYLGIPGLLLAVLGLWRFGRGRFQALDRLYLPSLALLLLSYGDVYRYTLFRLPGLVSERISTRLLIMPVLALLLRGCVRFDQFVGRRFREQPLASVVALGGGWLLVGQLLTEALMVRPPAGTTPESLRSVLSMDTPIEPGYLRAVWLGALVSLLGLWAVWQTARRGAERLERGTIAAKDRAMAMPDERDGVDGWRAKRASQRSLQTHGILGAMAVAAAWLGVVGGLWLLTARPAPTVNVRWHSGLTDAERSGAERDLSLVVQTGDASDTASYFLNDSQPSALERIVRYRLVEDTAFIDRGAFQLDDPPYAIRWLGHTWPMLGRPDLLYLSAVICLLGSVILRFDPQAQVWCNARVLGAVAGMALLSFILLDTSLPWALSAPLGIDEESRPADAIVVSVGDFAPSVRAGGQLRGHLGTAVDLYRRGLASHVVLESSAPSDLAWLRRHAADEGVPESAIVSVVTSGDVHQHVAGVRDLLQERHWRQILLVGSPYTMRRTVGVWRTRAPEVRVLPVPVPQRDFYTRGGDGNLAQLQVLVHEYAALGAYWWRGWT